MASNTLKLFDGVFFGSFIIGGCFPFVVAIITNHGVDTNT